MHGEGRTVAGFVGRGLDGRGEVAAWVGDEVDVLLEVPLERELGVGELVVKLLVADLIELRVGERMALEVDEPAFLHLLALGPGQVVRIGADEIGYEEDRAPEVVFLENRERVLVVVNVAVIERDDHGLVGQGRPILPRIEELGRRDRMVAVVGEVFHLRLELIRVDGQRVFIAVVDLVVVQHRDVVARRVHAVGAEGEKREDQRGEQDEDALQRAFQPFLFR